MPQMSPMLWLNLFIYFMLIYLIMMIMVYNLYILKDILNNSKNTLKLILKNKKYLFLW